MANHTIQLRNERPEDYRAVEALTREAFWNHYAPGCSEHYLLHLLRNSNAFLPHLDFVAERDGLLVGNIVYSRAAIAGDDGNRHAVITFGPISVLPKEQGKGVGSMMIEHTKAVAKDLGHSAILIYGDPDYYCKFGFVPAQRYGITTSDDWYAAALLALELTDGALRHCSGRFLEDNLFNVDETAVRAFDQSFPPKELRQGGPSQARFAQLVQQRVPRR